MPDPLPLPEPDIEYKLAARLLGKRDDLDLKILESLVGRPRRYSELKPLLKGRRDHVLTKSLQRLRRDGVIDQGLDLQQDDPERYYSLTNLGVLAVFRVHEMRPVQESIEAARRGGLLETTGD